MIRKTAVSLVLGAAFLTALAGCSSTSTPGPTSSPKPSHTTPVTETVYNECVDGLATVDASDLPRTSPSRSATAPRCPCSARRRTAARSRSALSTVSWSRRAARPSRCRARRRSPSPARTTPSPTAARPRSRTSEPATRPPLAETDRQGRPARPGGPSAYPERDRDHGPSTGTTAPRTHPVPDYARSVRWSRVNWPSVGYVSLEDFDGAAEHLAGCSRTPHRPSRPSPPSAGSDARVATLRRSNRCTGTTTQSADGRHRPRLPGARPDPTRWSCTPRSSSGTTRCSTPPTDSGGAGTTRA